MSNINETPGEIALRAQLAEAQRQITEMRQLNSVEGFVNAWFNEVKKLNNGNTAFEILNAKYYVYFGKERYTSFKSFEVVKNRHIKIYKPK